MVNSKKQINLILMAELGPPKISFPRFLLKILAGMTGGVIGTLLLLLVFVLSSSILTPVLNPSPDQYVSPIFIFFLMVMIFLATTVGNLLSTFLISYTEQEKYTRRSTAIYQIFIVHIIIFILMVPVYFVTSSIDIGIVVWAVALHVIVSAQTSMLVLEIVSDRKYALVGLYGVTFSILISALVIFLMAKIIESPTILLFAALPVVWGSIAFTQSVVTMVYGWIVEVYDKDFLAADTVYGQDYGKTVEKKEAPKAKDEKGADFLRHN